LNSFFRVCVMIVFFLLGFSLIANFVGSLGIFPDVSNVGISGVNRSEDALRVLTGLEDPSMQSIFVGVTGLSFIGVIALAGLTRSLIPIGLHLFGLVFWTSWIRMLSVLSYGGYIPGDFLLVFTVGVVFVFIAAIIGLLTGGG